MDKSVLQNIVTISKLHPVKNGQKDYVKVELKDEQEYTLNDKYGEQKLEKSAALEDEKESCIIISEEKDTIGDTNKNYKVKEHNQRANNDPNARTAYIASGGPYQRRADIVEVPEAPVQRNMDTELRQDAIRRRRSSHYYEEVDIIFQDPTIRLHFIRKVYMILALMLLCTFGFTTLCIFEKYTKLWILEHPYVVVIALGINIITTIALMCCQCARRVFPLNLLLLVLVTMSMSYVAAFVSCFYDTQIVMSAFGGTALICIVLTFIACQNWFDITTWGIYFCIAGLIVIVYGVVAGVVYAFTGNPILNLIYSCLVCLLTSMILIYDTQQVVGGKRIQLSPEEYILGALQLYVDIITIYIFILDIFSGYQ